VASQSEFQPTILCDLSGKCPNRITVTPIKPSSPEVERHEPVAHFRPYQRALLHHLNFGHVPHHSESAPLPTWAHEFHGPRKVALVTQGTLANHNFGLVIGPTLAALANEPDLLVVATAGGGPIDAIPSPIPGNARLAQYLPFEWMLPKVDVFVTQRRLWQRQPGYELWNSPRRRRADRGQSRRERARRMASESIWALMADEFGGIDTRSEVLRIVSQISHASNEGGLWRGNTMTVNRARRVGRR
jgi:hypothetical protein